MDLNENTHWITDLDDLWTEIKTAEHVYGTLVTADVYPSKRPYFKKRHFKLSEYGKTLGDELRTITDGQYPKSATATDGIFEPMETIILEQSPTFEEVDTIIVHHEQKLVECYQNVLAQTHPHTVMAAILQSQADEQNHLLLGLEIDRRVSSSSFQTTRN